ncbi:GntR family transcriptional regulator [Streptomyces sp. NPDC005722]
MTSTARRARCAGDPAHTTEAGTGQARRRLPRAGRTTRAGTYPAGERFPAVNTLAAELDVAPSTIQKAVAALRTEGKLHTILGQGSYVTKQ